MAWSGRFRFGAAVAAYFGPADHNSLHAHAAYQIVLGAQDAVVGVDEHGVEHRGPCFLIPPLVLHAVQCAGPVTLIYFDPHCAPAFDLMDQAEPGEICALSVEGLPFDADASPDAIVAALDNCPQPEGSRLDRRLGDALAVLGAQPGAMSIAEAARACGVSQSRLRTLAREQFGVPLSTWLIWRKLEAAARALAGGAGLADAAIAAGFADQAHFTRAMRRMFGVTPTAAAVSFS